MFQEIVHTSPMFNCAYHIFCRSRFVL